MTAISVNNLSKTFKKGRTRVKAVNNVSFEMLEGDVLGIIGANGAGKSTTIKCILDLIRADEGEISIFGKPSTDHKSRIGMAFVAENSVLNDLLTPRDVLSLALSYHKIKGDNNAKIMTWLERLDVAHVADKRLRTMSKGMAQRVALASAMVVNPRILILDEPLSGLDPIGRASVVDMLAEYKQQGGTLMFTSHVLHDVERLADNYIIIHKGKLVSTKSATDLINESRMVVQTRISNTQVAEELMAPDDVWAYLEAVKAQGHQLISVKPELNLENYFYAAIEE